MVVTTIELELARVLAKLELLEELGLNELRRNDRVDLLTRRWELERELARRQELAQVGAVRKAREIRERRRINSHLGIVVRQDPRA
jgi:hypothetical protein